MFPRLLLDLVKFQAGVVLTACSFTLQASGISELRDDVTAVSNPNSAGTLRSESEMERKPEVPASTQDEAKKTVVGGGPLLLTPSPTDRWG